ncbi:hypothetical protein KQI84_10760 [bacterium]|nr:hypothetical protein [bacterium]
MNFVRISSSQIINLNAVTRIEVYEGDIGSHTTIHFQDGEKYRCTEEEAAKLMPHFEKVVEETL